MQRLSNPIAQIHEKPWTCREVFTPFSIKLRNTKPTSRPDGDSKQPISDRGSRFGEMTQVVVPFINVNMDSKEFSVLMDVVMNVGVAEVCHLPHSL